MQLNRKHIFYICFSVAFILFVECLFIFKPFIKMMELYTLFLRVNPESLKPVLDFGAENFVLQSSIPVIPSVEFADYPLILDIFFTTIASNLIAFLIFVVPNIFIDFCLGISVVFSFCIFSIYMSHAHSLWIPIVWPCLIQLFVLMSALTAKASLKQNKQISMLRIFGYDINEYPNAIPYVKNIVSEPKNTEVTLAYFRMKIPQLEMENYSSEDLVYKLNEVFSLIVDTSLKYSGIIDKTSNNSIVVYWLGKDNAYNALQAAMEISSVLEKKDSIIRVTGGISTENSIFALLGSESFANYTIIGSNQDIAARLENACIFHNTSLLISGNTFEKVKDKIIATHKGILSVNSVQSQVSFYVPESFIQES